ncbi:MAG: GvpL/GvpF family gas vesicle protein, partial [Acidobacteriota bacterium]
MNASEPESKAIYLFCFTRPDIHVEGMGIDDETPLFLHSFEGIGAVISRVSLDDFTGPDAEERMRDVEWIGPRALRHGRVIEQVMRSSPVFPARFGTIFTSMETLERAMSMRLGPVKEFLDLAETRDEWAVKAFLDVERMRKELFAS